MLVLHGINDKIRLMVPEAVKRFLLVCDCIVRRQT